MPWGGSYSGMQHYGVTVFRLASIAPPADATMHIESIDLSPSKQASSKLPYMATARIQAVNGSNVALNGATVNGKWTGAYSATVTGMTDSSGNVVFSTPWVKRNGTFTFTVTSVVKSGYTYVPSAGITTKSITVR